LGTKNGRFRVVFSDFFLVGYISSFGFLFLSYFEKEVDSKKQS